MKTSVILHVEHPDEITSARVAVLIDKMVGIGMQEAHDTIEFDAPEDFEGAREAIQLRIGDTELCTVAGVSNFSVLKSLCEMLYIAEGSDPHDFDEDTQRIFNEAQAARDAAADPCPECQGREVLCNFCGGCGYVPKGMEVRCERCKEPATTEAASGEFLCPSCYAKVADDGDDELPPCPESNAAGELVCPNCTRTEFVYVEDIQNWRQVLSAMDGRLNIDGLYHTGEGYDDGENGRLCCKNCCTEYALPEQLELTFE